MSTVDNAIQALLQMAHRKTLWTNSSPTKYIRTNKIRNGAMRRIRLYIDLSSFKHDKYCVRTITQCLNIEFQEDTSRVK